MSGFFALRRQTWVKAAPIGHAGFKIGLELYVKARCRSFAETPIEFGVRQAGASKANVIIGIRYFTQLCRLYWFRFRWHIVILGTLAVGGIAFSVFGT